MARHKGKATCICPQCRTAKAPREVKARALENKRNVVLYLVCVMCGFMGQRSKFTAHAHDPRHVPGEPSQGAWRDPDGLVPSFD